MSPTEVPPNCSAERISSSVVPAAPFRVMPKANDALSGEAKIFASTWAALSFCHSANENAFAAVLTCCSCVVSARGRSVRAVPTPGSGAVPPAQLIDTMVSAASATVLQTVDAMAIGALQVAQHYGTTGCSAATSLWRDGVPDFTFRTRGDFPDLTGRAPVNPVLIPV